MHQRNRNFDPTSIELALKTKGCVKGYTLKLENDTKRDNQLSKDQLKL